MKGDDPMSKPTSTDEGVSLRKILIGGVCMAAGRELTGGDNGRNGQEEKRFYIFQPEQRRAYHEHDHDQRRNADLLQGLGQRSAHRV
jgi:hypothetical protein